MTHNITDAPPTFTYQYEQNELTRRSLTSVEGGEGRDVVLVDAVQELVLDVEVGEEVSRESSPVELATRSQKRNFSLLSFLSFPSSELMTAPGRQKAREGRRGRQRPGPGRGGGARPGQEGGTRGEHGGDHNRDKKEQK